MIFKLTLRNLRANAGRFVMTTFGVVLAVSFVVSAFVLGDGLRQTFGDLSTDIVAGTDIEVRPIDEFGSPTVLTDADVSSVLAVDGVIDAVGLVEAPENSVRPITPSGDEITTEGPPQLAFNWADAPGFSPFTLVEGSAPQPGDFVMDLDSAARHEFVVGDSYTVVTATGRHELTLSGLTRFGSDNQTVGATLMAVATSETDALFGTTGFDNIAVALSDAGRSSTAATQELIASAVPGFDVVDQVTLLDETSSEFNSQISIIQNVLLGFAGISLLVSTFIIANTFAIVLQQRTREMGLLRLVGADASQLRRSALGEAGVIGLLASVIGIPGGVAVAAGLSALFEAIGASLPSYETIVSARTLLVALAVGLGVTLVSAWWPTRKATRVPAIAALRAGDTESAESSTRRTIAGAVLGGLGLILAIVGVTSGASTSSVVATMALGSLAMFGGLTLVSPRLVAPAVSVFSVALDRLGMPGRLAGRNARRQAGRTATTATALMIGLAVVSMALVVGASAKSQLQDTLTSAVQADYLITEQASEAGFPSAVIDELTVEPAFGEVTGFRNAEVQVGGEIAEIVATRTADLPALFDLDISDGLIDGSTNSTLVRRGVADTVGYQVGDTVEVTLQSGSTSTLNITGIFDDESIVDDDWIVDVAFFDNAGITAGETWIAFNAAEGATTEAVASAIERIETRYPQGELETASEFGDRVAGLVDQILSVLNALVALAVIIALIGIANTLALSVSERTREIGLMRAVGMTRRGVRRMVRYESAVISAFGAVLGVVSGIGLGWLTVVALPPSFADAVSVPTGQILTIVVIAAVAGLGAALLPARRAGRMNVLEAIAA